MVAVPISRPTPFNETPVALPAPVADANSQDLTKWVAAGAVVAGGALMVTGHRKAGLAVAAAGTALALLEEQELVAEWWKSLPTYLSQAQDFLEKVEHYLAEASVQGQRIQSILRR
jgi:hypothetical protein